MRKEEIRADLKELVFEFFYWFSRFEFALKENKILKSNRVGVNAEPGWKKFTERYANEFKHNEQTYKLLELNPKRQKVCDNLELKWKEVDLSSCNSELDKVVCLLKTIRNNLFHGGKHGAQGWDEPERIKELLMVGKDVLDNLACIASFEEDYRQLY